jgi:hypothetical protein
VSPTFQQEVDAVIDDLLEHFAVSAHRLNAEDRGGWIDDVMRAMRLPVTPPQIDIFATK